MTRQVLQPSVNQQSGGHRYRYDRICDMPFSCYVTLSRKQQAVFQSHQVSQASLMSITTTVSHLVTVQSRHGYLQL